MPDDDARLRTRLDAARGRLALAPGRGAPALVGRVYAHPTVPATTGVYFSVHPVAVAGAEAEGGPGVLTADAATSFLAYVPGGRVPVAGDDLVCRFIGHRWVADPIGGAGITACTCTSLPASLTLTVAPHGSTVGDLTYMFHSDSLVYQPWPTAYVGLPGYVAGGSAFLCQGTWTDQFSNQFRYYFYCTTTGGNTRFFLTRLYVNSIFGSPFEDTTRYTWTLGLLGCTCGPPFRLPAGVMYAGGDPAIILSVA
jgi:hypothetical protein